MRFKLDENLGARLADVLSGAGHDVATVPSQGMSSAVDHDLIVACREESRCLVTLDLDFANPFIFPPAEYPGIVVLRIAPKATWGKLLSVMRTLAAGIEQNNPTGQLWIVELGRIRVHQPSSGS